VVVTVVMLVVDGSLRVFDAHAKALGGLLVSGVVGTGISYFLWFYIVRRLPATTASLGVLASPVVGVISSMLILGERPTLTDVIGFALMFAASACFVLRPEAAGRRA